MGHKRRDRNRNGRPPVASPPLSVPRVLPDNADPSLPGIVQGDAGGGVDSTRKVSLLKLISDSDDDDYVHPADQQVSPFFSDTHCTLAQVRQRMIHARAQQLPCAEGTHAALLVQENRIAQFERADTVMRTLGNTLGSSNEESSDDEDDAIKQLGVLMNLAPAPRAIPRASPCVDVVRAPETVSCLAPEETVSQLVEGSTFWRTCGMLSNVSKWIKASEPPARDERAYDTLDCLPEAYTSNLQSVDDYLVDCLGGAVGSITRGVLDREDAAQLAGWGRAVVAGTATIRMRVYPRGFLSQGQSWASDAPDAPGVPAQVVITTRSDCCGSTVITTAVLFNPVKICSLMERADAASSNRPRTDQENALAAQLNNAHHKRSEVAILPLWCSDSVCRGVLPFGLLDDVATTRALADSEAKYAGGIFTYGIASKLCDGAPVEACGVVNSPQRWVQHEERLLQHCNGDPLLVTGVRTVARTIVRTLGLYHVLVHGTLAIAQGAQPHPYKCPVAIPALIGVCVHMALDRHKISALGPLTMFEEEALKRFRVDWLCEAAPLERATNGHAHYALDHLTAIAIEVASKNTRNEGQMAQKAAVAHCGCLAAIGLHIVRLVYTPLLPNYDHKWRQAEQPDVFAFDPFLSNQSPHKYRRHASRVRDALLSTLFAAEHAFRRPTAAATAGAPPSHRSCDASLAAAEYFKKREAALHAGINHQEMRHHGQCVDKEAVSSAAVPIAQIIQYGAGVMAQAYNLHAHLVAPTVSKGECCVCNKPVHVLHRLFTRPRSSCGTCERLVCFQCQAREEPREGEPRGAKMALPCEWHCPSCHAVKLAKQLSEKDLKCIEAVKEKLSALVGVKLAELCACDATFRAGVDAFTFDGIKSGMEAMAVMYFFDVHHAKHGSESAVEEAIDLGSLDVTGELAGDAVNDAAARMQMQIVDRLDMSKEVGQVV